MNKEGYQPIKTKKTTKIILPNTGSHVQMKKDGYTWEDLDRSYWEGFDNAKNKMEKRIAEQEELLNSTLEENKDIYKKMADLDTALEDCTESLTDARIKIKELEKENEELKDKLKNLESVAKVRLANWQKYEEENKELKEQIEKMKCCQNCKFEDCDCIEEPCSVCTRCLGNLKRKGNSDKWEIKENDR